MPFKILLGALIGGALMFGGGFIEHMLLDWCSRHMKTPANESALRESLKNHFPEPGIYGTPSRPKDFATMPMDKMKAEMEKIGEEYKKGSAYIIVPPTNQEMMNNETLGKEFGSKVIAAFLASIVVAMTRPSIGFIGRWFVVVLIGLFSWPFVNASYHIWYRFPWEWVHDELMCAALSAAMGGLAIAAIVVPRERATPGF
jgi:hypothetical protein